MKNKNEAILYSLFGLFISVVVALSAYAHYNETGLTLKAILGIILLIMMIIGIFHQAWKKFQEEG